MLKRGKTGLYLQKLIKELRRLLYPYCAINLKETKRNTLKDFLNIVDVYGLSHMFALTNTQKASYLRLARMPSGPTITFQIEKYCLAADLFREDITTKNLSKTFNSAPILIINGFSNTSVPIKYLEAIQIVSTMFQSVFPAINPNEFKSYQAKKVVLLNLNLIKNKKDELEPVFELRHYDIDFERSSSKKTISNILNNKKTDFSNYNNIADYILNQTGFTDVSDNEGIDTNLNLIEEKKNKLSREEKKKLKISKLEGNYTNDDNNENLKNNNKTYTDNQTKVKIHEIGPRLNLKLVKIEEGFFKGNVAFHKFVVKSKKEIYEKSKEIKEKKEEKQKRREEQEANVKRKEEEKFNKLPEEKQKKILEKREQQEKLLNKKRRIELKEKKDADKQVVMSKSDVNYINKLKKGK